MEKLKVEELVRLLDHLPALVASWDGDGRNRYANAFFRSFLGVDAPEVRGTHIREVMTPERYEANRATIEAALAGEPQLIQRAAPDQHGAVRHIQLSYVPNIVGGAPDGFFVLGTDVSALVRAEEELKESVRQLALLEERQRIAADLHDVVIQRLYAAGLELSLHARQHPETSDRLASAALGVDEAIRHLRAAIHSLSLLTTPTQIPASVAKILSSAERTLGFAPTVSTTGSTEQVPSAVANELLAVLTEALSNVARHAGATRVEVSVVCSPEEIVLRVADDGRGMGKADRSSGLTNMRQRAERLGGSFLCKDNDPHGTVIDWWVPLE